MPLAIGDRGSSHTNTGPWTTGLNHDTTIAPPGLGDGDATPLLDLDGLAVQAVEQTADGARRAWQPPRMRRPRHARSRGCSRSAGGGVCVLAPRGLPQIMARLDLRWRKRRWYCCEPACPRRSFTVAVTSVPARARITTRPRSGA